MSVNMDVVASQKQANEVRKLCRKQVLDYEHINEVMMDFISNSPSLEGETYHSAKEYYRTILHPLAKGSILLSEAVESACKRLPEEYFTST